MNTPSGINNKVQFNQEAIQTAISRISALKEHGLSHVAEDQRTVDMQASIRKLTQEEAKERLREFDTENKFLEEELIALLPELYYLRDGVREAGNRGIEGFSPSDQEYEGYKRLLEEKIIKADTIARKYEFYLRTTPGILKEMWTKLTGLPAPINFHKWVNAGKGDIIGALKDENLIEAFVK